MNDAGRTWRIKTPYVTRYFIGRITIQRRPINGWSVAAWRRDAWWYIDAGRWRFEVIL